MGFWERVGSFFKGPPEPAETSNPFVRRGALWARLALRLSLVIGIVSILVYASTQKSLVEFFHTAGLGLLLLCASFLIGGMFGFLFGIPRKLQQAPAPEKPSPESDTEEEDKPGDKPKEVARAGYESNTSLEQISDWLTKILIGLTLTQWKDLRAGFQKMTEYIALAFGAGSAVFVGGIIIVGSLCGFFFGYLSTRLFLWLALTESDTVGASLSEARKDKNLQEAESLRGRTGGSPQAASLGTRDAEAESAEATAVRQKISLLAQEYETLRARLKSGTDRTMKMEGILSGMRELAPQLTDEMRSALQKSGSPGERLAAVAWLQVYPRVDELPWLAERLGAEKPFIGYHAALGLLTAARDPNIDSRKALDAIKKAQSFLEPGDAGTDRAKVLAQAEREARNRIQNQM